jgi:hypothetical protein
LGAFYWQGWAVKRYTQQVIQADTADAAPLNSSVSNLLSGTAVKSFFIILLVAVGSYWGSDIKSSGVLDGFLFPVVFGISVFVLFVWVVGLLTEGKKYKNRRRYTGGNSDGGYGGIDFTSSGCSGDSGGDGGGGD